MKKIVFLTLIVLISCTLYYASGDFVKVMGGANADRGYCVARAPDGAMYVGGFIGASLTVKATFGATQVQGVSVGQSQDIFIAKYTAAGDLEWVKALGGSGIDDVAAMSI